MFTLFRRVATGLAIAALAAFAATGAGAQNFKIAADGRLLVMEMAGHIIKVPGPLWSGPGETVDVEQSQVIYRRVGPGAESVLLLPADDTLVTWKRMMGILAVGRPGYSGAMQVASMVQPMTEDCTANQTLIRKVPAVQADGIEALLLMCGRYRATRSAPRHCAGGLILAVVLESGKGAVKIYDEWCTGAFDVRDRSSWPVSGEELQAVATELQVATAFLPATTLQIGAPPAPSPAPPASASAAPESPDTP